MLKMKHHIKHLFNFIFIINFVTACGGSGVNTNTDTLPLNSLSISSGSLDQTFQSNLSNYTATAGFIVQSLVVTATTAETGATVYVNSIAVDANNKSASIELTAGADTSITISVKKNGLTQNYKVVVTRQAAGDFAQQAYIKASNTQATDHFGYALAISGDTLAVGVKDEDSSTDGIDSTPNESAATSGAVYVFKRSGTTWLQEAYIKSSNSEANDRFGISVGVSGDTLVVGSDFEDSDATVVNGAQTNAAAGLNYNAGAAYVFTRSGSTWSQQAYLKASNAGSADRFGISVAIDGETIAVGSFGEASSTSGINSTPNDAAANTGAVYVFTRSVTTWTQQAYIKASNPDGDDYFGNAVSIDKDTLAVGSYGEDSGTPGIDSTPTNLIGDSGAVYVFARSGTTWSQQAYIKSHLPSSNDNFGISVSASGDSIAVGSWRDDSNVPGINLSAADASSNFDAGAAYVYKRTGSTWSQEAYIKASNLATGDSFGYSVGLSGDTLVVGAQNQDTTASNAGAGYIYTRSGTTWSEQKIFYANNLQASDTFGFAVGISNDTIAICSTNEDGSGVGVNPTSNEGATDSGAVYVFK